MDHLLSPIIVFVLLLITNNYIGFTTASDCSLDTRRERSDVFKLPLIIENNGFLSNFLYPTKPTKIELNKNDDFYMSCTDSKFINQDLKELNFVKATCNKGDMVTININSKVIDINFKKILCKDPPTPIVRDTGNFCTANGKEIEIGFQLNNQDFIRQFLICFNTNTLTPLWATGEITKYIGNSQKLMTREAYWEEGNFYNLGKPLEKIYMKEAETETINTLLGLDKKSKKYIETGHSSKYLARGHLVANTDFVYGPQQKSTLRYINAAPQWQQFNQGNWKNIETNTKIYATDKGLDLTVYTGTYGIATLPHEKTQQQTELYLYVDTNRKELPVPALFWKLIYEPNRQKAVVLIGINNPYIKDVKHLTPYIICNDIYDQLKWIKIKDRKDKEKGYVYACYYHDFISVVNYAPQLNVVDLLK